MQRWTDKTNLQYSKEDILGKRTEKETRANSATVERMLWAEKKAGVPVNIPRVRASLVVQWLRLYASTA